MVRTSRLPKMAAEPSEGTKPRTATSHRPASAAMPDSAGRRTKRNRAAAQSEEPGGSPGRSAAASDIPAADRARNKPIPFRMFVDAFAAVDEELAPEPEWTDFPALY